MKKIVDWVLSWFRKPEEPEKERPWTIQVFYDARKDNGQSFRATSVYHVDATNIGSAYNKAEKDFSGTMNVKFGAILPGKHLRFP